MLTSWTLENFKSVYSDTTLTLAPLTIFCGANSSGKSSIIQSILLVAQTLQNPSSSRPVVLNGHLVRLGYFDDIHSNGAPDSSTSIAFELSNYSGPVGRSYYRDTAFYEYLFQRASDLHGYFRTEEFLSDLTSLKCRISFSAGNGNIRGKHQHELLQAHPHITESLFSVSYTANPTDPTELQYEDQQTVALQRNPLPVSKRLRTHKLSSALFRDRPPDSTSTPRFDDVGLEVRSAPSLPLTSIQTAAHLSYFLPAHWGAIYNEPAEIARQLALVLPPGAPQYDDINAAVIDNHPPTVPLLQETKQIIVEILDSLIDDAGQQTLQLKGSRRKAARLERELLTIDMLNYSSIKSTLTTPKSAKRPSEVVSMAFWKGMGRDDPFAGYLFFTLEDLWDAYPLLLPHQLTAFAQRLSAKTDEYSNLALHPALFKTMHSGASPWMEFAANYLRGFFLNSVRYLGPLRDEPRTVYPLSSPLDLRDVGSRGEFTAAVLQANRDTEVVYHAGDDILNGVFDNPNLDTLLSAVQYWLHYLGVADDIQSFDSSSLGHKLRIATPGSHSLHDLTHVGVGVSQVLPIVVLGLIADRGATLLFEQPELHLHPRVQTRLADFFASLCTLGIQCIIETHSEYIINRLRYHAALYDSDTFSSDTLVYFVEQQSGQSTFRPITINRFGMIDDWPQGFFDESEEIASAILKAVLSKRKREQRPPDA